MPPRKGTIPGRPTLALGDIYTPDGKLDSYALSLFLQDYCTHVGLHPAISKGLLNFFQNFLNRRPYDEDDPYYISEFLDALAPLILGQNIFKSQSFNYLHETNDLPTLLRQTHFNAKTMIELMGADFFNRRTPNSTKRKEVWTADIEDWDNLQLVAEGGSGSGAFSLDFSIGIKHAAPGSHKLWRMGMDFEQDPNGELVSRIIRTGSAIRYRNEGGREKSDRYARLTSDIRTTPHRLLTYLCIQIAYDLGAKRMRALSTEGALKLSSLGKSKGGFDYTQSFLTTGFREGQHPYWLEIPDLQENFYPSLERSVMPHEPGRIDLIMRAFKQLQLRGETSPHQEPRSFPLTICEDESREEIQKAVRAFRRIVQKIE